MSDEAKKPVLQSVKVLDHVRIGHGAFLQLHRAVVTMVHDDGSESRQGTYEYLDREVGRDAVVVVLWRHHGPEVEVLIRRGLRMPLLLRKTALTPQVLDPAPGYTLELVAGLIEPDEEALLEQAPAGATLVLAGRALAEIEEEAGFRLPASRIVPLGSFIYPTTGIFAERLYFFAAQVHADEEPSAHDGDGSIFEENASTTWWPLSTAIAACVSGKIADLKTEIGLRRLVDHLASKAAAR